MPYNGLKSFVNSLEEAGELVRIREKVSPSLEVTEIYDRVVKNGGPAILFENTGTEFPLLINMMGSNRRICMSLGVNSLDSIADEIESLMKELMQPRDNLVEKLKMLPRLGRLASWMPKVVPGRGACQDVVMEKPDITRLPVQKCWPEDGGDFLTFPIIHTKDPLTGIRNVGLYRMQVFGPALTAMHWHRHKVSAGHFREYKKLGKRMPVSVALGGDPVYTYAATAPMPENVDEYLLAGFLRKKRVELVRCLTNELHVPADADFIIEGYIDPSEEYILEGPFGDHTGYYSLADMYPRFHITAITHRKNPIYPATCVGIPPQEDGWIGKATERIFLAPIKMTLVPEIEDMELPVEGVFHNITIVSIDKSYPGQAPKVAHAMWGAGQMMLNKMLVVTDKGTDIHDYRAVAAAISKNTDPAKDIFFSQGPMDVLDHSCSVMSFGGKMCIDATAKFPEERAGHHPVIPMKIDRNKLISAFPEIKDAGTPTDGFLVISIKKNRKEHVRNVAESIFAMESVSGVKFMVFVEPQVDVNDIADVVWRCSNNMDPRRDSTVIKTDSGSCIAIDGTMKTLEYDGFEREWPNIITMDEKTIKAIDEKWNRLGLGAFIPSPSLKYHKQLYGSGAAAHL